MPALTGPNKKMSSIHNGASLWKDGEKHGLQLCWVLAITFSCTEGSEALALTPFPCPKPNPRGWTRTHPSFMAFPSLTSFSGPNTFTFQVFLLVSSTKKPLPVDYGLRDGVVWASWPQLRLLWLQTFGPNWGFRNFLFNLYSQIFLKSCSPQIIKENIQ
jgi:hypothetical protein